MLETTANTQVYTVTSGGSVFTFNVPFFDADDVHCYLRVSGGSDEVELVNGTDFTVQALADYSSGADVTLAPDRVASGGVLVIAREVAEIQKLSLPENGKLPARAMEKQLDRMTAMIQQQGEVLNRTVGIPITDMRTSGGKLVDLYLSYIDSAYYWSEQAKNQAGAARGYADAAAAHAAEASVVGSAAGRAATSEIFNASGGVTLSHGLTVSGGAVFSGGVMLDGREAADKPWVLAQFDSSGYLQSDGGFVAHGKWTHSSTSSGHVTSVWGVRPEIDFTSAFNVTVYRDSEAPVESSYHFAVNTTDPHGESGAYPGVGHYVLSSGFGAGFSAGVYGGAWLFYNNANLSEIVTLTQSGIRIEAGSDGAGYTGAGVNVNLSRGAELSHTDQEGQRQVKLLVSGGRVVVTKEENGSATSGNVLLDTDPLPPTSGGYVNSATARQIAEEVVSSGGQVRSTVEVLNWTSTSGYIPVLSGGTCYNFLQPISALRIDAVPRSFEDATILCHFSGGTNFLYPPDLGEIGDVAVSSGFYRIAVNAKQLIAAPVRYTGPVGIYSDDGPGGVQSAWVMMNWNIDNNFGDRIVYNGGAASNVSVTSAIDGRGTLQVSGGYVEKLFVGSSGFVRATGGTISGLTVSAKGSAYVYGGEVNGLRLVNDGAVPQVRVSNGGIVRGVRTSGVCEFWLYSGGRAEQIDCAISTFCHVSGALITGGNYAGTRLKIIDGGRAVGLTLAMLTSGDANNGVLSDGIMSDCLIAPGGIYIVKGGTAYATTIGSSGARFIVSGGTASAVTISSGGTLTVSSGGTALAVTSNAGAVVVSNAGAVIEYA